MQEAQRVQAVQHELQLLRAASDRNAAAVAQLRAEMEQLRTQRSTASLLAMVLAALLAAVLAALAWRWYLGHRVERVGRWFEAHGRPAVLPPTAAAAPPKPDVLPEVDPEATTSPGNLPIVVARPAPPVLRPAQDVQASRGGAFRVVGMEELLDVREKANFFLAIGEVNQAVAVLEAHVHDQVETSALPWMDLLDLYHSLGRRPDFARVLGEFRERFSTQVPEFENFGQPTPTLENHGHALGRIVALWPTRRVLEVIEESVFRKPGLPGAEPFSLEAYRELVLLYHVATELLQLEETTPAEAGATNFAMRSLQPPNGVHARGPAAGDVTSLLVPPSSPNVGVDIDITAPDDEPDTLPPLDFDLDSRHGDLPDAGRRPPGGPRR